MIYNKANFAMGKKDTKVLRIFAKRDPLYKKNYCGSVFKTLCGESLAECEFVNVVTFTDNFLSRGLYDAVGTDKLFVG